MKAPSAATASLVLPGKVQPRHLDRLAIVYVRQSTLQQLEQHRESTALQYGLAERACRLGWPRPRVSVIDDDLGCSGASAEGRPGFQRLVAEVGLGHVGLVLGFEVSRLARSCRDWYHLLEICALAGTLIADSDGVYDPALYNDRLLLGLKGTMSEAELHIMRARLEQGRWHKAERGELGFNLPRGYLKGTSGEVVLDPDERVRDTIRLVFDVFARRGSVHGVLRYLIDHGIALPDRDRRGPARGEVVWRRPHRGAILNLLTSPTYAGAYVFGRRQAGGPGVGTRRCRAGQPSRDPADWRVLLPDRWPAYISWSTYEENQTRLDANRSKHKGVPRGGPSLLAGILFCGRCGHRMVTCYRNNGRDLRYDCTHDQINHGTPHCQSLSGGTLDALVTGLLLEVLRPSAIEVSLQLAEDVELERARRHRQWALRLEQARYEVERAERQYDAVEPENRLVARTLEQRWEAALAAEARLREEHARFLAREPPQLTPADREAIRALAEDIPGLWRAATTTAAERKQIARLLLERIEVTVAGVSENAEVVCHWVGGRQSRHALVRSVRRTVQLARHVELLARPHPRAARARAAPAGDRPCPAGGRLAVGARQGLHRGQRPGAADAHGRRVDQPQAAQRRRGAVCGRAHGDRDRRAPEPARGHGLQLALQGAAVGASGRGGLAHALARAPGGRGGAPPAAGGSGPASSPTGCITMTITDQRIDNPNLDLFWRGTMAKTRGCPGRRSRAAAGAAPRCGPSPRAPPRS
jgi:DNA invertase Pin-like site-specific DNA recombinase